MIQYDKGKIREHLSHDNIYDLLQEFGGDPERTDFGIVSATICHNSPGEGSRKLYYYNNTGLFKCYTGCDEIFDPFDLVIKVMKIQKNKEFSLVDAMRFISFRFKLTEVEIFNEEDNFQLEDWKFLENYLRIQSLSNSSIPVIQLKEYDKEILSRLNYNIKLVPWLNENISQEVIDRNKIGYFPAHNQITIPHFDIDNRFIGLRGRTLTQEDGELYGKYRPLIINKQLFNHPLGMNLYNLNNSKENIKRMGKVVIFEAEKSVLKAQSYFGFNNDIYVACCGSSLTAYQVQLLLDNGAKEICVAYDRQFQEIGDKEFLHLKANLMKLYNKYKNYATISFIFDKEMITDYKDSPIDLSPEIFLKLFKERIIL